MQDLRETREKSYRRSSISERAEREILVNQFKKEEEKKNLKNLLYGADRLTHPKDADKT